jgi:uncharacterized protein YcaQ
MTQSLPTIDSALARRLALTAQRLAGPRPAPDAGGLLATARALGCIQLDPISAVDRSHRLVWFSRVGPYDRAELDRVVYQDRQMFEYWAHCASYVLTEDYPLHAMYMRTWRTVGKGQYERARQWVKKHDVLSKHLLRELKQHGPVPSRLLEEMGERPARATGGWSSWRDVSIMLFYLHMQGDITVADRLGGQKRWDLAKRVHPDWMPRDKLPDPEVVRRAAEKSLRALGIGTARHIKFHFTRHRYPGLPAALAALEKQGRITRVAVPGVPHFGKTPAPWYIHTEDLPRLDALANGGWQPRTTLLSPFDNLICDRDRSLELFDFDFRVEIYVPAAKRKFGYYVLPIVHGDRIIGRVSPMMDRNRNRLTIEAVYAEPGAPMTRAAGKAVAGAIRELAAFLGAEGIDIDAKRVPEGWRRDLKE